MKKLLLVSLLLLTKVLFAQVPANDECASAATLITSTALNSISGNLKNATTSTVTSSCGGYNDVFYKFVATSASASVIVTPTSLLNAKVSVFAACGTTSIACGDNAAQGVVEVTSLPTLTVGSTYYIKVSSVASTLPSTPTFTICVVNPPPISTPPANEECASATTLTPSAICTTTLGDLTNAATSTVTKSCVGYNDVFYKFVATSASALITVTPVNSLDPKVSVFDACGATSITCVDNTYGGTAENVQLTTLTVGSTYYIKVSSYFASPPIATFTICVVNTPPTPPANDECANAISITPSAICIATNGTILNATTSTTTTSCAGSKDVFYKFVANSTTATVNVTGSAGLDLEVATFSACGTTSISCVDSKSFGQTETIPMSGLIIGNTYYIKVQDFNSSGSASTYTFTICVVIPSSTVPANDACANATLLTPLTTCNSITGTLKNATTSTTVPACRTDYNSDVFYKFVANANTTAVTVTPTSSGIDPIIAVYSSCGGTSIGCKDVQFDGIPETLTLTGLTVGATYFIQVSDYSDVEPSTYTFTICVQNGITTATQSGTALSAISLYPNPTQNVLNIENVSIDTKVELIDLTGKTIFVRNLSSDTQVDLSNYSAGVYILKLTSDGVSENRRVVLSK